MASLLHQVYNHVALPRDIPGAEENNLSAIESDLTDRLVDAVKIFAPSVRLDHQPQIDALRLTLVTSKLLNAGRKIDKNLLGKELQQLSGQQAIVLFATEQNAALYLYRNRGDVVFEAFETSAVSEKVLASDALQWDFPGHAVSVPFSVYSDASFQESLASFLAQASIERLNQFAAVTFKGGSPLHEVRDTSDPSLITGLLMSILATLGSSHTTPRLRKRVRDTVTFCHAYKPWRRSPFYLVLRVTLQRHLYQLLGPEIGRLYYKIIMCIFLSRLLDQGLGDIPDEASHFLIQKISQRLTKLEMDREIMSAVDKSIHDSLFAKLHVHFDASLTAASQNLIKSWEMHKRRTQRVIRPLPRFVSPSDKALQLQLPYSGRILDQIALYPRSGPRSQTRSPSEIVHQFETSSKKRPIAAIADRYFALARFEEHSIMPMKEESGPPQERCVEVARLIELYISKVGDAYDGYHGLKSRMLLNTMELWMSMDRCAVASYPLLKDYHPVFTPDLVDDLHLMSLDEYRRVQNVQEYISYRYKGCNVPGSLTIFDNPGQHSFAVSYYDSDASRQLQDLRERIEAQAERDLESKEAEWHTMSDAYEALMDNVARYSCLFVTRISREDGSTYRHHDARHCPKCDSERKAARMRIEIFEHPLPSWEHAAKAAVFELSPPLAFAAYRDATWLILSTYAYRPAVQEEHVSLLHSYSELRQYVRHGSPNVSLGSSRKSHLDCHYSMVRFPVSFEDICKPCGLQLYLFDKLNKTRTSRKDKPSFSPHFPLNFPADSPYQSLQLSCETWPSSNKILATQTICPADLSTHEHIACQGLLVGTHSRWPTLLRELGSQNLNFSTPSTSVVVSRLIGQVGPASTDDSLRDVHAVFHEQEFCERLLHQVAYRLEMIHWRESILMDTIISALLKLCSLTSVPDVRSQGITLLRKARAVTGAWCASVREASTGVSHLAICAAVLCKRTCRMDVTAFTDPESLKYFILASIVLQDNLIGKFHDLPHRLQNAVLEDLVFGYIARDHIQSSILANGSAFIAAVNVLWTLPKDFKFNPRDLCHLPDSWWVSVVVTSTQGQDAVQLHYNLVSGALLLNGEPLGKLPSEYRHNTTVQRLLGAQTPRVYPSRLPGCAIAVAHLMPCGYRVHLGFREDKVLIRAVHLERGTILEYIPDEIFNSGLGDYDLPMPLITNCYHWLDLNTRVLEVRQDIWRSKSANWSISLITRHAKRRESMLVDPHSILASKFVRAFAFIELPSEIAVFRTAKGKLHVELKRMELDFSVNPDGLLQSHELGSIIPLNQDAGTFHGLRSHIVIESISNRNQRSILVPGGNLKCRKDGNHVRVHIESVGEYLKFDINRTLGRLDCPAEPVLLYTRALLHAYTSHFLADKLTGRSGKEEALYYLHSGAYLPWTHLTASPFAVLMQIAELSPTRGYYPDTMKCMETVSWRPDIPNFVQDDRYRALVEVICRRSSDLELFNIGDCNTKLPVCPTGDIHLESRALSRTFEARPRVDTRYFPRDRRIDAADRENASAITTLLWKWTSNFPATVDVAVLLSEFLLIGGYEHTFDRTLLSDLLSINLGIEWGALCNTALSAGIEDKYKLIFLLAPMAFSDSDEASTRCQLIRVLVSYAIFPELKSLVPPRHGSFSSFKADAMPTAQYLAALMQHAILPQEIRHRDHRSQLALNGCIDLAKSFLEQWPSQTIDMDRLTKPEENLVDFDSAIEIVMKEWIRFTQNFELFLYIQKVQHVINRSISLTADTQPGNILPSFGEPDIYPGRAKGHVIPTLPDLLCNDLSSKQVSRISNRDRSVLQQLPNGHTLIPNVSSSKSSRTSSLNKKPAVTPPHIKELKAIVANLRSSGSTVQDFYGYELDLSTLALLQRIAQPKPAEVPFNPSQLDDQIFKTRTFLCETLHRVRQVLQHQDVRARWLHYGGLWPKITIVSLLRELRSTSKIEFGPRAKERLVELALIITEYQRLLRIQDASLKGKRQALMEERANPGHKNWSPLEQVDWLLLEIDGNIMIRAEQVEVAMATISPESGTNSVLQLLMGKGKTSCILPMVATVLADKRHLFRIVVPRPLLLQSAQVMQIKLGGLLTREILHVPFSRRTPTATTLMETYFQLHNHVKAHNGIVLALPEHLLSFKLSGLQRLCDGKFDEASRMIKIQARLDKYARDVLDECDVSLAIKTQLIYPSGSRTTVDGHPLRWQTVQAVLHLIESYLPALVHQFPRSIEVVTRAVGGYPLIYFLRRDAEAKLVSQLIQAICRGQTSILPCAELSASDQKAIETFISLPKVPADVISTVTDIFRKRKHWLKVTHLVRGLIIHRLLLSTLKKRWNVQYGLHPARDPLAVPFHAKGVPSPTAEWGHPDVAIILTCLSFYYQGLHISQFKQAFDQLLKTDEPSIEYDKWVTNDLPDGLKDYNSINAEDISLLAELYLHMRYNTYVLDFYLNSFVFPKYAKQFSTKLSASGWDLVLYDPEKGDTCKTTGFSGTNDSKHQLPLTIQQSDLANLTHTNAEVLAYLLEERNRRYVYAVDVLGKRLSEEGLLQKLLNPHGRRVIDHQDRIRILIDAGAQILEHNNRGLASLWLSVDHEAAAAVYFEDDHKPYVLYRKGKKVPLVASPFAENLGECVIYLDQSHCRGTDLKFPPSARAALTLGPDLTKDNLVQAAMRLRLLGQSQSVTFFAPPEVHQAVLDLRQAGKYYDPTSADVIRWLLEQTCNGIEQLEPLYYTQGTDYLQRVQSRLRNPDFLADEIQLEELLNAMRSKEAATLKQLYAPKESRSGSGFDVSSLDVSIREYGEQLVGRKKEFRDRGLAIHASALEEVELEREREVEVETEVENVREVQPPIHFEAHRVSELHQDIVSFAKTGRLHPFSDAYRRMIFVLQSTGLGRRSAMNLSGTHTSMLYASTEFEKTIKILEPNDNFLRPVHWVLWSPTTDAALIISPEEADALIPILRHNDDRPRGTHLIVYAAPVTRRMLHFNNLDYYAIPQLPESLAIPNRLKLEVGIFAGRLYLEWDELEQLQKYLGLTAVGGTSGETVQRVAFAKNPLAFLHDWLAIRRKGQDFEHTPMGYITTGKPLCSDHPFFTSAGEERKASNKPAVASFAVPREEPQHEDDDEDEDEHDDDDGDTGGLEHLEDEEEYSDDDNSFFDAEEFPEE